MTFGIDARFFGPKNKGLGRYTQKLIENLEKIDSRNDYVIFLRRENFNDYRPQNGRFRKVLADYRWYSLAEQIFMPLIIARHKVDLMHFPHFNIPLFYRGEFVVTIHDLILRRFGTRRSSSLGFIGYWLKNLAYRIIIRAAIKKSRSIITVSEYVKKEIIDCFHVLAEKIAVTYEGVANEDIACLAEKTVFFNKCGIRGPYLLYVGNSYPHKNLERLIDAFDILIKDYGWLGQLVFVGDRDYFYRRLETVANGLDVSARRQIIFAGLVSEEDLVQLYCHASVYVFPSLCEGFGLPPLEAMARGVPVVSSGATCLPEILGPAAVFFNPREPKDMAQKISAVLNDANLRQDLVVKGYQQLKKYSWREMARQTLQRYTFR